MSYQGTLLHFFVKVNLVSRRKNYALSGKTSRLHKWLSTIMFELLLPVALWWSASSICSSLLFINSTRRIVLALGVFASKRIRGHCAACPYFAVNESLQWSSENICEWHWDPAFVYTRASFYQRSNQKIERKSRCCHSQRRRRFCEHIETVRLYACGPFIWLR